MSLIHWISVWTPVLAPALVATVLLVVPGLVVNLGLGARGFDALGLAPLSSLGVLAVATLLVPVVVGRWSVAAVALSLLMLTVVAVLGRVAIAWQTGRGRGDQLSVPLHTLPWTSLLTSSWTSLLTRRPWVRRRRTISWLAATALAAGLVAANFVMGVRDPGLPSQTIDAGFHYNAVLGVIHSGLADGGQVGAASGAAATAWYPPLWHDLTALATTLTGVNVVTGANGVAWAIGGVVWPLSMVWLCSRILPHARLVTTLALGLCCGAISLSPYVLLSFGVLWPNALSLSALPAAIALTLMVLHLMPRSPHEEDDFGGQDITSGGSSALSWWTVLAVGFLGCLGMTLAHPGALFALGIWVFVSATILSARLAVRSRARGLRPLRRSLLLLLLGWSAVLGLWAAMNLVPALNAVRDKNWVELMTTNQAMGQALTLSTLITKAHWAFGAATLWGFYRLRKVPRLRWLLVSHVLLVFLYVLCAGAPGWLARELTGFWYNDAQRVAALIPMTAVPLAAMGITDAVDVLARLVARVGVDLFGRPLSSHRALVIACLGMIAVPVLAYPDHGIGQGATVLQDRYANRTFSHHLVTGDEQVLYERLATQLTAGETVLGSPFTGAQFSGIWSEHGVVIPHTGNNPKPDVALVAHRFRSFTTDPQVCAALKRLRVGVVVDDSDLYQPADIRQGDYSGLIGLRGTPGLTPIGSGVSAVVYRVGPCRG